MIFAWYSSNSIEAETGGSKGVWARGPGPPSILGYGPPKNEIDQSRLFYCLLLELYLICVFSHLRRAKGFHCKWSLYLCEFIPTCHFGIAACFPGLNGSLRLIRKPEFAHSTQNWVQLYKLSIVGAQCHPAKMECTVSVFWIRIFENSTFENSTFSCRPSKLWAVKLPSRYPKRKTPSTPMKAAMFDLRYYINPRGEDAKTNFICGLYAYLI